MIPIHVGLHSEAEIKEMYFLHMMSYLQMIQQRIIIITEIKISNHLNTKLLKKTIIQGVIPWSLVDIHTHPFRLHGVTCSKTRIIISKSSNNLKSHTQLLCRNYQYYSPEPLDQSAKICTYACVHIHVRFKFRLPPKLMTWERLRIQY